MSYRKQAKLDSVTDLTKNVAQGGAKEPAAPASHAQVTLQRIVRHVADGNYQKALDLLRSAGRDPQLRNILGVCLLRLGRVDEAVRVFRELVLQPGCTWLRRDIPTVYKTNFATALLLQGHPAGCQELLGEVADEAHPAVKRLRAVIKRWSAGLGLLQKLNWRFGNIEPANCQVSIDFLPGDLDIEVARPDQPTSGPESPSYRTAI